MDKIYKFNVGDWIVDGNNVLQVVDIFFDNYVVTDTEGHTTDYKTSYFDSFFRLWNIQDVKAGDVLAAGPFDNYPSPFIAIYKERGLDFFNSYCFVSLDGEFVGEGDTGHDINKIHPATKEQRDILFTKIKEAGFEWDAEKLELKPIKHKHNLDIEIPYGAMDSELVEETITIPEGCKAVIKDNKVIIRKVEKPVIFNDEDMLEIDEAIFYIKEFQKSNRCKDENDMQNSVTCVNWLNNIKNRYNN